MNQRVISFGCLAFFSNVLMTSLLVNGIAFYVTHIGAESLSQSIIAVGCLLPIIVMGMNFLFKKITHEKVIILYYVFLFLFTFLAAMLFYLGHKGIASIIFFIISYSASQLISMSLWLLIEKHFNVLDFKKYASIFMGTEEVGALICAFSIKFFLSQMSFYFFCGLAMILLSIMSIAVFYITCISPYRSMLYVNFYAGVKTNDFITLLRKNKIFTYFITITCIAIMFEPFLMYEFGLSLEKGLNHETQLNEAMSLYKLYGSIIVLIFHFFISPIISRYLNTGNLLFIFGFFISFAFILPLFSMQWEILLASMVLQFGSTYTVFILISEQLLNSLSSVKRIRLKSFIEGILKPSLIIFSGIILLPFKSTESLFLLNIILLLSALFLIKLSFKVHKYYIKYHLENLHSPHKEECVKAIQTLGASNYRGKNDEISDSLLNFMNETNHNQIRSTIIAAFGEMQDPNKEYIFFEQMNTTNELIQTETIIALGKTKSFLAQSFLIHSVITGEYKISGYNTRKALSETLYKQFKNGMVPMLIPFLNSNNPRVVSYTLDAMANTHCDDLFQIIIPFIFHENSRIKSSALMLAYNIKKQRKFCLEIIDSMYKSDSDEEKENAVFIIGALKIYQYKDALLSLSPQTTKDMGLKMAFALSNFEIEKGYELFCFLLLQQEKSILGQRNFAKVLRHFVRLPINTRIRILDSYVELGEDPLILAARLSESPLNFIDEIQYLKKKWWTNIIIKEDLMLEECLHLG